MKRMILSEKLILLKSCIFTILNPQNVGTNTVFSRCEENDDSHDIHVFDLQICIYIKFWKFKISSTCIMKGNILTLSGHEKTIFF